MTDIRDQKADLRRRMRRALAAIDPGDIARAAEAIRGHILASDLYARARSILLFLPMPGECDLGPLARDAASAGKRIHIPCVDWEAGTMAPVRITDPDVDAPPDARGVPCPRPDLPRGAAPLGSIDLILVPGLSFDRRGGRLGRARGFYDRLLSDQDRRGVAIGVAIEAQIVDFVPQEPHDQFMNGLVTENGLVVFEDSPPGGPI